MCVPPLSRLSVSLYGYLHHTEHGDNNKETVRASCPEHIVESNTIHSANATHSIRGSKTLGRHRPTTAPQARGGLLSKGRFFLFVSFQLWNEQLQRGIRTNFRQDRSALSRASLHSLSQGKVYSSLISLLFPPSPLISPVCPCCFSVPPPLFPLSVLSSLCSSVIRSKGLRVG